MPTPLDLPDGPTTRAFRAFVRAVQTHPKLAVIKTWKSWEGRPDDDAPPALGLVPWCRLTPLAQPAEPLAGGGGGRAGTRIVRTPIRVAIELVTAGPRVDDGLNLWDRFADAIWPAESAARSALDAKLAAAGIRDVRLLQPARPASLDALAGEMIVADGAVALDLALRL